MYVLHEEQVEHLLVMIFLEMDSLMVLTQYSEVDPQQMVRPILHESIRMRQMLDSVLRILVILRAMIFFIPFLVRVYSVLLSI